MVKTISDFSELEPLGVDPIHVQILEKFAVFKGRIIQGGREFGANKYPEIPPDGVVSAPHRLHNLVRGVYVNQTDKLAQSITSNPESKWGKEVIYEDTDNWIIDYDFGKNYKFPSNITALRACYDKGIPIGVILHVSHGVNKILGLGQVSKVRSTKFEIIPFVLSSKIEQETEQVAYNYEKQRRQRKDYSSNVKERTILARASQQLFREDLIFQYKHCLFCGLDNEKYLTGAHIVPHSIMQKEDPENAMNPSDGLLLCKLCDIAFEKGDIQVSGSFEIQIKESLKRLSENNKALSNWLSGISKNLLISGQHNPAKKYLEWKLKL